MFFKYFFAMLIALNLSHAYAEDKENYLKNQTTINILKENFTTYKLVGKAKYTYFLLDIYDAKLLSETGNIEKNKFALILEYNRDISKKNDVFIGIKNKNNALFYFNKEKVLETQDIEFIDLFFNIWLRKNSQNPDFTKTLLGQTN